MMTKKEMIKNIVKEYLAQYELDCNIYNALAPLGVYVNIETSLDKAYLENILNSIDDMFIEYLFDINDGGLVEVVTDSGEWIMLHTADELIDFFVKKEE